MDDAQVQEYPAIQPRQASGPMAPSPEVVPAQCPSCKAAAVPPQAASTGVPNQFAYLLCHVVVEQPNLGVEKYGLLKMRGPDFKGLSKDEALRLAIARNPDLARQECYVALVGDVETYILAPVSPDIGYPMLVEAIKADISAIIGTVGPIAGPDVCNGITLPILFFDVIFNFNKKEFIDRIPVPDKLDKAKFHAAANSLWDELVPLIGPGTGSKRAVTNMVLSDHWFWDLAITEQLNSNAELRSVDVKPASSTSRALFNVMVTFYYRDTFMERTYSRTYDLSYKFVVALDQPWRPCIGGTM